MCRYRSQQVKNCDLNQQCVATGANKLRTVTSTKAEENSNQPTSEALCLADSNCDLDKQCVPTGPSKMFHCTCVLYTDLVNQQSTRTRQKCGCVMSKRNLPEVLYAACALRQRHEWNANNARARGYVISIAPSARALDEVSGHRRPFHCTLRSGGVLYYYAWIGK